MTSVRALRRRRGLSLLDVARSLAVAKPTVSRWERGSKRPTPEHLAQLAAVLGIPCARLRVILERHRAANEDTRAAAVLATWAGR